MKICVCYNTRMYRGHNKILTRQTDICRGLYRGECTRRGHGCSVCSRPPLACVPRPAPLGASETRLSLQNSIIFVAEKNLLQEISSTEILGGLVKTKDTRVLLLIPTSLGGEQASNRDVYARAKLCASRAVGHGALRKDEVCHGPCLRGSPRRTVKLKKRAGREESSTMCSARRVIPFPKRNSPAGVPEIYEHVHVCLCVQVLTRLYTCIRVCACVYKCLCLCLYVKYMYTCKWYV